MHEGMSWFGFGHWFWGILIWGAIVGIVFSLLRISKKK
ncbi:hypothetical protein MNBD_GAMMA12-1001 [hydrothermal vent metagenome]|uniref:Uncharacterized protein n=1 Tax=hydrothermal vent metagenome TaxID=652676 RepID=A0A3B0YM32_9ZZZZ